MKRSWWWVVLLTVVIAVGAAAYFIPRGAELGSQQAHIGIATWPGFAPSYLAKERGYFGDIDVTIDLVDDFSARQAAFTSGQHDFTVYTIDSLAFDTGHGVDGEIVLVLDESRGADGIVARAGISRAQDLRGRRVAYTRGSPAHFFLVDYLRDAGMTTRDITTVEVDDPTRAAEAFLAGSVDAAVTWEPYLGQIQRGGQGVVLADTRTRPGRIVDVLVASRRALEERPEVVRAVVVGWRRALEEIAQPQADTSAIMARGLGMPEADFTAASGGVTFADRDMIRRWLARQGAQPSAGEALFATSAQLWREETLSNSPTDAARYFYPRYALE